MAIQKDIHLDMYRGDTPVFEIAVTNIDGTPFDLTGYSIWMTAKQEIDDADPGVFQASSVSGEITITNAVGGIAQCVPTAAMTSALLIDEELHYDIQVRRTSPARTHTVAYGRLIVKRDITRV